MRRFFTGSLTENVILSGEEHNHISRVLRLKKGDKVILFSDGSAEGEYEIISVASDKTELRQLSLTENIRNPKKNITLFFGLCKGEKNDMIVQKATELGVSFIVPFESRYTVSKDKGNKTERFVKIAEAASKQCGRSDVPKISKTIKLSDFENVYDEVLFAYENGGGEIGGLTANKLAVIVGAEGGFSKEEAAMLNNKGVRTVTLGKRILRAETAAIALLAVVAEKIGEWQ